MWLLDFLVDNYYKVTDWFGSNYSYLRNGIANLPTTIGNLYNTVVTYYYNAIAAANTAINNFYYSSIVPLWNNIQYNINNALSIANSAYNNLSGFIASLPGRFYDWYQQTIANVRSIYDGVIAGIIGILTNYINPLLAKMNALFPFQTWLSTAASALNVQNLQNLVNEYNALKGTLIAFISNPVGFIIGVIQGDLIKLVSFLIAYGFGTMKYNLPPMPIWGKNIPPGNIPIPVGSGVITKPLDSISVSGYSFSSTHLGVDLGLNTGDAVYAAHDGVVSVAAFSSVGYGNQIDIDSDKYHSRYGHLDSYAVAVGQRVTAGMLIGRGGSTGNSTGPHLHFELKVNGVFVDPLQYI